MQNKIKRMISALVIFTLLMPLSIKTVHADVNATVRFHAGDGSKDSSALRAQESARYFYNNNTTSVEDKGNASAHFDFNTNTLTLNNYDFGPIVFTWFNDESQKDIKIVLKGHNKITVSTTKLLGNTIRGILVESQKADADATLNLTTEPHQQGSLQIDSFNQVNETKLIDTRNTSIKLTNNAHLKLNVQSDVGSPIQYGLIHLAEGNLELLDNSSLSIDADLNSSNFAGIKTLGSHNFLINTTGEFNLNFTNKSGQTSGTGIEGNASLQNVKSFKTNITGSPQYLGNFDVADDRFYKVEQDNNPPEIRHRKLEYYNKKA